MDLLSLFLLWTLSKAFDTVDRYALLNSVNDRQQPRNFIALLQNWLDIMLSLCSVGRLVIILVFGTVLQLV